MNFPSGRLPADALLGLAAFQCHKNHEQINLQVTLLCIHVIWKFINTFRMPRTREQFVAFPGDVSAPEPYFGGKYVNFVEYSLEKGEVLPYTLQAWSQKGG